MRVYTRRPVADRFWEKVKKTDGCWLWTGAINSHGYGNFWDGKRYRNAHDVAYELCVEPIPARHDVHHTCENPPCVRPKHLEAKTRRAHTHISRGFAGRQIKMTHCKRGHPLAGDNLRTRHYRGKVMRDCRACMRLRQKKYNNTDKGRAAHRRFYDRSQNCSRLTQRRVRRPTDHLPPHVSTIRACGTDDTPSVQSKLGQQPSNTDEKIPG